MYRCKLTNKDFEDKNKILNLKDTNSSPPQKTEMRLFIGWHLSQTSPIFVAIYMSSYISHITWEFSVYLERKNVSFRMSIMEHFHFLFHADKLHSRMSHTLIKL